jgi:hypothetical protein
MQVWNYNGSLLLTGFGMRETTIEYSSDSTTWSVLPDVKEFERAPGKKDYECNNFVDFDGQIAKSVRITASSNWGGAIFSQYGLSEVRFLYLPVNARKPYPDSGATDVDVDVTLSWRAGREATEHDVYLSTDEQAVVNGDVLVDTVSQAVHGPLSLDLDETYYWKINEVNTAETPTTLEGEVWNFTTRKYLIVDHFEDYDAGENQIWYSWHDGMGYGKENNPPYYAGNGTGSAVGDETTSSYTEEAIVHGGGKAMPYWHDNAKAGALPYSEATLQIGKDWTVGAPTTLVLWFYGDLANSAELMYAKVNEAKVAYSGDPADLTRPIWTQWNIDLASLDTSLENVTELTIGFEKAGSVGGAGKVIFDDIRLYREAPAVPSEMIWIEAEAADSITPPLQIFSAIPGASGGQYIEVESGNNSTSEPPAQGIASYNFAVGGESTRSTVA